MDYQVKAHIIGRLETSTEGHWVAAHRRLHELWLKVDELAEAYGLVSNIDSRPFAGKGAGSLYTLKVVVTFTSVPTDPDHTPSYQAVQAAGSYLTIWLSDTGDWA